MVNEYHSDESNSESDEGQLYRVNYIEECVLGIEDHNKKKRKPYCEIDVSGVTNTFMADSGSPYTIIDKNVWISKFTRTVGDYLQEPDINPKSFTGEPIKLLGYRKLTFQFKGRKAECKLYVAEVGPSVLGWWDQGELDIILNPNSTDPVLVIYSKDKENFFCKEYPKVFSEKIGELRKFCHEIILKDNATPRIHKVMNIPV